MTTTSLPTLTAQIEERLLAPLRRNALAARGWFGTLLAFVLILHGGLLALLLRGDEAQPQKVAQETPVEVIVEPPKPEPKPPPPPEKKPEPPKQQAKPEIEKPASSAPRAPSETKVDTAALQKETHAPKAATPPKDGTPEPAKDAASPSDEKAEPDKAEEKAETKPDVLEQDREALDKAVPLPPRRPEMKLAKVPPLAKTKREKTALDQLAGASSLPDYSFARPTKKSRVHGGNEDSRYLAIVFGMIMAHRPQVSGPGDGGSVTVAFNVGDDGRLIGMGIQRTSGYPELDAAATTAIRRAAPFPPLPPGAPHGLVATIDFSRARPAYTMDDEDR